MQHIASSWTAGRGPLLLQFLVIAFLLTVMPLVSMAQESSADTDTTTADEKSGRVRISIDESGISVEGEVKTTDDGDSEWVIVDDQRSWKEKGTDIVRFGEGVFVGQNELVRGDLVVFGGDVIVEGRVTGNVVVLGGSIRARSGAEIKGDAVVIGGGELDEDEDVIIRGERVEIGGFFPTGDWSFSGIGDWWGFRWFFPVILFVKIVLVLLTLLFLPERLATAHGHLRGGALKSFGVGVLSACVGFFASIILMVPLVIMIVGIPLALLIVVSWLGLFIIAWTVASYSVGRWVAHRMQFDTTSGFVYVLTGTLVISLADILAYGFSLVGISPLQWSFEAVGCLIRIVAYICGLGALISSRFGSRPMSDPELPDVPAPGDQAATA
jgi:hypothetical protein